DTLLRAQGPPRGAARRPRGSRHGRRHAQPLLRRLRQPEPAIPLCRL
ncbi:MAG: hypothetical protein AVDCRST_MAG19-949, partial [uncultured Thermomicrobiales bacterium]